MTRTILTRVPSLLKRGVTEKNLAWQIRILAHESGADDMAFDTIVAFGEHTSRPHHRPTDRKLVRGDIVQIDMGVRVKGYCSDMSRVYFTGKKTPEQSAAFSALRDVVAQCKMRCRAGARNRSLDAYARAVLKRHGFGPEFTHGLGHGVGLDIHEGISLSRRAPPMTLRAGEVVTIEPGLYFPGKWGMRLEDTVLVGADRCKTL